MSKLFFSFLMIGCLGLATQVWAQAVEFGSTNDPDAIKRGDTPSVDDPYKGKTPSQKDYDGHSLTQKSYDEACTTDECKRAEQRQTQEGSTWREDVKTGLHKGYDRKAAPEPAAAEDGATKPASDL